MKQIKKILCVVEPDQSSEAALFQTLRIAEEQQADVTFASTMNTSMNLRKVFKQKAELDQHSYEAVEKKRNAIEKWIKHYHHNMNSTINVYSGISFIEIIKQVIVHKYDLVVKCANNVDWLDRLFGSDDMHLLRKCPCPVLMLKPNQNKVFRNVLATIDVNNDINEQDNRVQNKLNEKVLEYSTIFSLSELATLHIGSAWELFGEDFLRYGAFSHTPEEKIDRYAAEQREECADRLEALVQKMTSTVGKDAINYLRPKMHLVKGLPSKEIPLMVNKHNIDLIVMGTVARTGIPGFIIGNTAESILEQVQCSVLAVKPDGFSSPIK